MDPHLLALQQEKSGKFIISNIPVHTVSDTDPRTFTQLTKTLGNYHDENSLIQLWEICKIINL